MRDGRIDSRPPTCLTSTGQWGFPITVATLLTVDMDLTQQTHRSLLATLAFNNCEPSSPGLSPSISPVSPFCGLPCLSICPPPQSPASPFFVFLVFCLHTVCQTPGPNFFWWFSLESDVSFSFPSLPVFLTPLSDVFLSCSFSPSLRVLVQFAEREREKEGERLCKAQF